MTDPIAEPIVKKVKLTDSPNKTEKVVDNNLSSPVVNGGEMHFPGPLKQILPENASFGTSSIFTDDKLLQSPKNNIKAPIENKPSNEFANFKVYFLSISFTFCLRFVEGRGSKFDFQISRIQIKFFTMYNLICL